MQTRRLAAIVLGVSLLVGGCAGAVSGRAVAGATISSDTPGDAPDTADESSPPADAATIDNSAPPSASETSPSTSLAPIPPVDPTRETTIDDPGPADTGANAEPLAAPPFQGSTLVDPASFAGLVTDVGFQSPSGNIACGFYDDGVACQISEYDFEIPPRPDECGDTGWGFNFAVDDIGGFMFCAGDVEGGGPDLTYGQQLAVGDFHCVSREDGISCIDAANGGGFTLSREAYELF